MNILKRLIKLPVWHKFSDDGTGMETEFCDLTKPELIDISIHNWLKGECDLSFWGLTRFWVSLWLEAWIQEERENTLGISWVAVLEAEPYYSLDTMGEQYTLTVLCAAWHGFGLWIEEETTGRC